MIAKHLGVRKTICRVYSMDTFDADLNINPELYGIDKAFSSPAECANSIIESLRRHVILESIQFSNHDATLITAVVTSVSPLQGVHLPAAASNSARSVKPPTFPVRMYFPGIGRLKTTSMVFSNGFSPRPVLKYTSPFVPFS